MRHSGASRSGFPHWRPPACIWVTASRTDFFPYSGDPLIYFFSNLLIGLLLLRTLLLLVRGKLLIRVDRATLLPNKD